MTALVTVLATTSAAWVLRMWWRSLDRSPARPGPWVEGPAARPATRCRWVDADGVRCAYSVRHLSKPGWRHDNPFVKP